MRIPSTLPWRPWLLALLTMGAAGSGCAPAMIAPGETLVVVDTDLPVPDVVEAVRLDVYADDGTWLSSRDVDVAEASQWPLSFGVAAPEGPARVLVRVRAYPMGRVHDYTGAARSAPARKHEESVAAASVGELCAHLPELPVGGATTLLLGEAPITGPKDDGGCSNDAGAFPVRAGAGAAQVRIETAGTYRFEVVGAVPVDFYFPLFLRRDCTETASEIACARGYRDVRTMSPVSVLETALEPGTYTLLTTHFVPNQSAQVVVRATAVGAPLLDAGPPSASPPSVLRRAWPRLIRDGRDETPPREPREEVSTEAFAFVDVAPDAVHNVRVVLGGDCVGKAARVPAISDRRLDVAGILACEAGRLVSPHQLSASAGVGGRAASTLLGTFAKGAPCAPARDGRICTPGGMMLFGSALFDGMGDTSTTPERVVRVPTFYVDKDEFSVADFRAARASGYVVPPGAYVVGNEGPLPTGYAPPVNPRVSGPASFRDLDARRLCTYSKANLNRDDMPLNCVTWPVARELCRRRGGELPTEVAWEYGARKAGRARATLYPWGNEDPTCDSAVYDRVLLGPGTGSCAPRKDLEGPQSRRVASGDVTPLGVRNLAGSVAEWTLDSFAPYTQSCWLGAPVDGARCDLADEPYRTFRGASYASPGPSLASPLRDRLAAMDPSPGIGFRCVYPSP
ncbi:MAG: SUMF1/EgtB/PvdO family nonheme iron enzyme [Polyangiaceae bacterium]|nr:SUMF1/EgtB/PvdO family nonheme iron enzyme [Polyangiaceae bacterium]